MVAQHQIIIQMPDQFVDHAPAREIQMHDQLFQPHVDQ